MRDAELNLLRARYDLKLDVERVRTNAGVQELREACEQVESQRQVEVQQFLSALTARYEESATAERATHEVQLKTLRFELEREYRGLIQSLREEVAEHKEKCATLSKELDDFQELAARAETELRQTCVSQKEALQRELQSLQALRAEDAVKWKEREEELRTVLTQELVSRFQLEHFDLTTKFSQEYDARCKVEADRARLLTALNELQASTRNCLEDVERKRAEQETASEDPIGPTIDQSVQTEDVPESQDNNQDEMRSALCQIEAFAMQSADREAELLRLQESQVAESREVLVRLQRVVALKNEMIDELKTALGRKEEEALEAQAILRGLLDERGER